MTKYDLLDVLGSLDEKYLQEAEQRAKEHADFEEDDYLENIEIAKNEKPRRFPVYFGMTIAAGLALVVGATCFFANRSNNGLTEPAASVVTVPMNEISSPDSSGSTVPTIVTEVTETTTLAVTTTVTKANENSMPDMLVPTQTQDPSLITTDPNDHVTYNGLNIFGGVGNVEIECGGDVLVFADQKNMYVSDSRMIYPKNPADLSVHGGTMNGRLMENYGLNPRQTFISDGESLFAYDVDVMSGSISRLSLDASEWETFSALPFEHAEFMMIDSISRYQGGYLFIFSNCMNLNVAANQSAYLYDPDTKEWTPIITGEDGFGSFHITAGTMNESHVPESLKLTVCRPVDTSDQTKREFAFYDVSKANGCKLERKQPVVADASFTGYQNNEWCVGKDDQIYMAFGKDAGTKELYALKKDIVTWSLECIGECGEIIYLDEERGMIYSNPKQTVNGKTEEKLVQINLSTGASEDLLNNAQIRAISMDSGVLYLALHGDENHGYDDYLIYPIRDEERLMNGEYALDEETDKDLLAYLTGSDGAGSGHAPFPTRARKWMGDV